MTISTTTKENVVRSAGTETYTEVVTEPDRVTRTVVTRGVPVVTLTNCYCCSCWSDPEEPWSSITNDPACRNHGFAARRPCEVHHMPGEPWGAELEGDPRYGTMPESVQQKRMADQKRHDDWKATRG